jgi:hypothetical protein
VHTQQLRGFDESRNDQGIIQNRSAKTNKIVESLYLPASISVFEFFDQPEKSSEWKMAKMCFLTVLMEVKII